MLWSLGVAFLLLPASPAIAEVAAIAMASNNTIAADHAFDQPAPPPRFMAGKLTAADDIRILVMEQGLGGNGPFYYDQALENLGLARTLVHFWEEFETLLTTEGPWDLVIANSYGNNNTSECDRPCWPT
jgi:hypothetical protein